MGVAKLNWALHISSARFKLTLPSLTCKQQQTSMNCDPPLEKSILVQYLQGEPAHRVFGLFVFCFFVIHDLDPRAQVYVLLLPGDDGNLSYVLFKLSLWLLGGLPHHHSTNSSWLRWLPQTSRNQLVNIDEPHIIWYDLIFFPTYTGKLCHRGKCHSGNCHSGERWMSRPFVHSGNLNFKHTLTNDLVFHNAWKRIICHFIT